MLRSPGGYCLASFLGLMSSSGWAQPATVALPDIDLVGQSPLPGPGIDRDLVPAATTVLDSMQINRTGVASLTGAILEDIPGAAVNEVAGNSFQPDILYHGFTASPVAGTAQGLAVYVNGARFNDPFGDTVNWDLIPSTAIQTVDLEASNPVYGLNALGGAINVQMKNGFTIEGGDTTAYGGSYGRGGGAVEYGWQLGNFAVYGAAEDTHEEGFRQTQESDVHRLYTDLGWRNGRAELHLSLDAADNTLGQPGAAPVQELNADPSGIFTGPNTVYNKYVGVNISGNYALNGTTSLQALAYFQNLTQRLTNGATFDGEPCDDDSGGAWALCNADGTPVTTHGGSVVPDFLDGNTYSALVREGLETHAYGASAQMVTDAALLGLKNHLDAGGSFDGSDNVFNADTSIGSFTTDGTQLYVGPPEFVQVQPDEGVQPVKLATVTRYYGLYFADVLNLAPGLALSIDGRFNNAEIDLHDKMGQILTGQHSYNRFNPSAGLTYAITPAVTAYFGYGETNRAPTPTELSCASEANPCSLLNFFIGDPDLKQVVAKTIDGGFRGKLPSPSGARLRWSADYYHTADSDDLIFQTALNNPNLAFYTNAGRTLRQGVEANVSYDTNQLHAAVGYAYTAATFESPLLLGSAANPGADANGNLEVRAGDRIPGIPMHRGTFVVEYKLTNRWSVGGSSILNGSQYRFGDEANRSKQVGGYILVNFNTSYRITDHIMLFGLVNNVTNRRYDTYGTFGPVDEVPFPNVPGGVNDPRTADPGQPISGYGGLRVTF